jgi:DNA-binding transcriptional MerR regulator
MSNLKSIQKSFFTISKTAEIIGVQPHVLRFWEKKFSSINPKKNLSGRRFYSSIDVENLLMIKKLLYEDGFTIKGAISVVDKTNKKNKDDFDGAINFNLTKSIDLIQQGLDIIKRNIN